MTSAPLRDFLFLMHAGCPASLPGWGEYLAKLRDGGWFQGGSSIGGGACVTKAGAAPEPTRHLVGYIKIRATDLAHATELVAGNPVYEAGGVVEIRELPTD